VRARAAISLAAVAALASTMVSAQPAASPLDEEPPVSAELVVRGRLPGPAWWRVSDGDTTVYVLGIPGALPKKAVWNQTVLKRRLKGANVLIIPPSSSAGVGVLGAPALMRLATAERPLPAPLAERVKAAAVRVGGDADDLLRTRPWFAGVSLMTAYERKAGLDAVEPLRTILKAAKKAKVKSRPMLSDYRLQGRPFLDAIRAMPEADGTACLEAAVEQIERGDREIKAVAAAWTVGDARTAVAGPRNLQRCWYALPGFRQRYASRMDAQVTAVEEALKRPGHAVAVLPLSTLVVEGGVLHRLRARGHQVRAPE